MKNTLLKFIATSILACLATITMIVILIAGKYSTTREHVITEDGVTWYTNDSITNKLK